MRERRSHRRLLGLVLAAAGAILGGIALTGGELGGSVARRGGEPGAPRAESGADAVELGRLGDAAERAGVAPAIGDATATTAAAPKSARSLAVRFVDAQTGAPLPEHPYVVFGEQGRLHLLDAGRADGEGRVVLAGIEDDVAVVEALRAPPRAATARAVWLAGGAVGRVDVPVGRGSRVTGRVVDDTGEPVAGVDVRLEHAERGWSQPDEVRVEPLRAGFADAATTDERGEYAFDAVASRAEGVWLVDGESRPERWLPVRIWAECGERRRETVSVQAGAARDARAPDIVLSRPRRLAGVVLDAGGVPLAGARVRARSSWATRAFEGMWPAQSAPPGAEGVTDGLGRFEVEPRLAPRELSVEDPGGWLEVFPVEDPGSGGAVRDLVLRLTARARLAVDAVDAQGGRLAIPDEMPTGPRLVGDLSTRIMYRSAQLRVGLADGSWRSFVAAPSRDGLFRVTLPEAPADVRELELELWDLGAARAPVAPRHAVGETLRVEVVPFPSIVVELVAPSGVELGDARLEVRACALDPGTAARQVLRPDFWHGWSCCGMGSSFSLSSRDLPKPLAMPVRDERPFLVAVIRPLASPADPPARHALFGPYLPGEGVHRLELPPDLLAPVPEGEVAGPVAADEPAKRAPPPTSPEDPIGGRDDAGEVALVVLDASTGARIEGERLRLEERGGQRRELWRTPATSDGGPDVAAVPAGSWVVEVRRREFLHARLDADLAPGARVDLGIVSLDPLPVLIGRLREADGRIPHGTVQVAARFAHDVGGDDPGSLFPPDDDDRRVARTWLTPKGELRLAVAMSQGVVRDVVLDVQASADGLHPRLQRVVVPAWRPGVPEEIELAPWTRVAVRVHGIPPERSRAELHVVAGFADRHGDGAEAAEDPPAEDGARTFRLLLGPGRYLIAGAGAFDGFPPVEVEIERGREELALDVDAMDVAQAEARARELLGD